jgi:hypothetical protein
MSTSLVGTFDYLSPTRFQHLISQGSRLSGRSRVEVHPKTMLPDAIRNGPEMAPPAAMIVEEMMILIVFPEPNREFPRFHFEFPFCVFHRHQEPETKNPRSDQERGLKSGGDIISTH